MSRLILIVDDTECAREALSIALLAIPEVEVRAVASVREAKQLLDGPAIVQAVCTDLDMPVADGFELVTWLRSDHRFERIPILVVSANSEESTPARVRRLGADAHFLKPFSPAIVRQTMEHLLHAKQNDSP